MCESVSLWVCISGTMFAHTHYVYYIPHAIDILVCQFDTPGKRCQLKNCLLQIGLWTYLWGIFLIADWCGMAGVTVGNAFPGLVALGSMRMQAEKAMKSKPVSNSLPCPLCISSCLKVYPAQIPVLTFFSDKLRWCKPNKTFSLQVAFGHAISPP